MSSDNINSNCATPDESSVNTSYSSASSAFLRDEQELTAAQRAIVKRLPPNRTLSDLLATGFAFPFARVLPKRDLIFYLHRIFQVTIGPFLFLIRLVYGMFFLVVTSLMMRLAARNVDLQKPLKPGLRKFLATCQRIGAWGLVKAISFRYIREEGIENKPDFEKAHVCVCNHVNAFDPVMLSIVGLTCFMGKADIQKFPFFGTYSTCGQCLFVDRGNKESRDKSVEQLNERIADPMIDAPVGSGRRYPLITVFPEGTTVNQHGLLPFKRGAFLPGKPVNPIVIRYSYRLNDPCDAIPGLLKTIIAFMFQVYTPVTIKYLPEYRPSPEEVADPELYAQNVRIIMAKELGIPMLPFSYRDKMHVIEGLNKPEKYTYEKCSSAFKEVFPVEGELNRNSLADLSIPQDKRWRAAYAIMTEATNKEEAGERGMDRCDSASDLEPSMDDDLAVEPQATPSN